jgi:hypothetical protein
MTRQIDGNEPFFVLNSNTIYFSIIFANRFENTKCMKFLYKVNLTWKHLHGDWSQIPAKRTNTEPTAWLQTPAKRRLRQTPL